ncbi:MAG: aromatic-ring-hydroxylating dioxygenase subunit beta [Pseudomonadota bacterium]
MALPDTLLFQHQVEQFVYAEVRLLDERRWEAWEALFAEEGTYWAPAAHDQPNPEEHVSLIYENALLRKVRQQRFKHPNAFSLQPFPRTSHLVSNVMIDQEATDTSPLVVSARFIMHEFRRGQPNSYAGAYRYELVTNDGGFLIQQKKATLVNCNGTLTSSAMYF